MKIKTLLSLIVLLSSPALAIEFITEAEVQESLEANKVIEISSKTTAMKLARGLEDETCSQLLLSRSSRAYVVKKDKDSYLYVTSSGLKDLTQCSEL